MNSKNVRETCVVASKSMKNVCHSSILLKEKKTAKKQKQKNKTKQKQQKLAIDSKGTSFSFYDCVCRCE